MSFFGLFVCVCGDGMRGGREEGEQKILLAYKL